MNALWRVAADRTIATILPEPDGQRVRLIGPDEAPSDARPSSAPVLLARAGRWELDPTAAPVANQRHP